ncbi:MAG: tight junction protein ZO-3 [Dysgonamonadaceae bacterium]|jgi:hypothetical protein|nr:tight junction protein ZO-3 [Dysgonamonadaceae bacterium]
MKSAYFLVLAIEICYGCTNSGDNRISFTINPENHLINIPVCLQDSIMANMLFDSGAVNGIFRLDSTFVANHPSLVPNVRPNLEMQGSAWGVFQVPDYSYTMPLPVKLGQTTVSYDQLHIYDMKRALGIKWSDGIFNMPKNDTVNVWEWNFEHDYLEIHPVDNFKMPEDCYLCPMKSQGYHAHYIQFSMQIQCADGDTLSISQPCWVDMGIPNDLVIVNPSDEWMFFDKKDSDRIECRTDKFGCFYKVNAIAFDGFIMDSMRLYVVDNPYALPAKYIVGLNFLKRFNLFFNKKHGILGLQPLKKYKRLDSGKTKRFYFSVKVTENITWIVTKTGNHETNSYKTAGLQRGDEITGINNMPLKTMTDEQYEEFQKKDTLIYDIIRDGKPLKLVISVDKTEEQGD